MWTALAFAATVSVLFVLCVKLSSKLSRARRIRRVLRRRNRYYRIKEAAAIAAFFLMFASLFLVAYSEDTNATFDFSQLARSVDDAPYQSKGAVRPVPASETSTETASIKADNGEGAMSCPVGRGLVLLRRVVTRDDPTQVPRTISGAFETATSTLLECRDDDESITSCDGYRNYKFNFYSSVAVREIGVSEEVIPCAPYDHFEATAMFRSYIVLREYDGDGHLLQ